MAVHPERSRDEGGSGAGSRRKGRRRWFRWSRRTIVIVTAIAVLLVVLRLAAPLVLKSAINRRLARVPAFRGHVEDIDLQLWRGAYALDGVTIRKRSGAVNVPFLTARRIDFSVAWRELLHGRVVSDIVADEVRFTLVRGRTPESSQVEADRRWQDVIRDLFPIEVTHLAITNGDLHFVDQTTDPELDLTVHDIALEATGLRNRKQTDDPDALPAAVNATATTMGDGHLRLTLGIAPLEQPPLFDVDAAVEGVSLPALNPLLRAYANVDVSRGTFDMYMEIAAHEGAFRGYVKPFFRDLDFENLSDRNRSLLGRVWESIVNFMDDVLKNPQRHQLGTRVPFSGNFNGTEVGVFTGILNAVRNGFGAAFSEAVEGRLEPEDVQPAESQ